MILKSIVAEPLFRIFKYLRRKTYILMYHRVLDENFISKNYVQPGMYINIDSFEKNLQILTKLYEVIPLSDLIEKIERGIDLKGFCSITFDDGWLDNYSNAFPLLKKYRVPATIFLTTNYIDTSLLFWPDEISNFIKSGELHDFHGDSRASKVFFNELRNEKSINQSIEKAINILKSWNKEERDKILNSIRCSDDFTPKERQLLNWDEVQTMYNSGLVSFGSHTANHVLLDQIDLETARHEIHESLETIKHNIGVYPEFFAYPNGNYTQDIKEIVRDIGLKAAFTVTKGFASKYNDIYEIPRIGIHEDIGRTESLLWARMNLSVY